MIPESDFESICAAEFVPWEKLRSKTVLITGGTGLIGSTLIGALLYASEKRQLGIAVLALVRDENRARQRFADLPVSGTPLRFVVGTIEKPPVIHILELAREKKSEGVLFTSSMEVYGHPPRGQKVTETDGYALSPLDVRNSYPISKLQCESMCCAYAAEYGVPAVILRLAQTFGPGVHPDDRRIFAEFGRCVREKRDIVLHTPGETERSYLYTADAATAILTAMLKGRPGQAYNAADERTYCSIADMARNVAAANGIGLRFELDNETAHGYPEPVYMDLDTSRLQALGWEIGKHMMPGGGINRREGSAFTKGQALEETNGTYRQIKAD